MNSLIELIEGIHSDGYHFYNEEAIWIKEIYDILKAKPIGIFKINDLLDFIFTFLWETDCMQKILIVYRIIWNGIKIDEIKMMKLNQYCSYGYVKANIFNEYKNEMIVHGFIFPNNIPKAEGYKFDWSYPRLIKLEEISIYIYKWYDIYKRHTIISNTHKLIL